MLWMISSRFVPWVDKEKKIRAQEDADLLDTVIETQGLIQKTVLEHFGANSEGNDGLPDPPRFDKLEQRLSRRGSRASVRREGAELEDKDSVGASDDASAAPSVEAGT